MYAYIPAKYTYADTRAPGVGDSDAKVKRDQGDPRRRRVGPQTAGFVKPWTVMPVADTGGFRPRFGPAAKFSDR